MAKKAIPPPKAAKREAMLRTIIFTIMMLCVTAARLSAQTDHVQPKVHPEDREVDMDDPTFVPMVKVGKALEGGDSPYLRMPSSDRLTTDWFIT